jgi:hypothetical protein
MRMVYDGSVPCRSGFNPTLKIAVGLKPDLQGESMINHQCPTVPFTIGLNEIQLSICAFNTLLGNLPAN